jgi:hypothetical protein
MGTICLQKGKVHHMSSAALFHTSRISPAQEKLDNPERSFWDKNIWTGSKRTWNKNKLIVFILIYTYPSSKLSKNIPVFILHEYWLVQVKTSNESRNIFLCQLLQPQHCYFGFLAASSAKLDNIYWNKFEETLFRWLIWTTFLQILSHPQLSFGENGCRWCHLFRKIGAFIEYPF